MMKKIIAVLMTVSTLLALCACHNDTAPIAPETTEPAPMITFTETTTLAPAPEETTESLTEPQNTTTTTTTAPTQSDTPTTTEPSTAKVDTDTQSVDFGVHVLRVYRPYFLLDFNYDDPSKKAESFWLTEKDDFAKYFDLSQSHDGNAGISQYDDAFFENHNLIMLKVQESSGSIHHEVQGLRLCPSAAEKDTSTLQPELKKIRPEGGISTCDMAMWAIFLEVSKDYGPSNTTLLNPVFV